MRGDEDEEEDNTEGDDVNATALSLSNPKEPLFASTEKTAAVSTRLARFTLLNRLDLSHSGLPSTAPLARAVELSRRQDGASSSAAPVHTQEDFGRRLTWLNLANNEGLGKALLADEEMEGGGEGASKKRKTSSGQSSAWTGLELLPELFVLNLSHCALPSPPPIKALPNLRALILNHNDLTFLNDSAVFPLLPHLNTLVLSHNKLVSLPSTLPSSCPSLAKLSITFNDLGGTPPPAAAGRQHAAKWKASASVSLPDFTPSLALREVRLGHNPKLGSRGLPAHVASWARGYDRTGKGLQVLELNTCGIEDWNSLGGLLTASPLAQAKQGSGSGDEGEAAGAGPGGKRVGGLGVLNLKDNGICRLPGYREKILAAHPNLRSLDEVSIDNGSARKPRRNGPDAGTPSSGRNGETGEAGPSRKRKREEVDGGIQATGAARAEGRKAKANTDPSNQPKSITDGEAPHLPPERVGPSNPAASEPATEGKKKKVRRGTHGSGKKSKADPQAAASSAPPTSSESDSAAQDGDHFANRGVQQDEGVGGGEDEAHEPLAKKRKRKKRAKSAAAGDATTPSSSSAGVAAAGSGDPTKKKKKEKIRQRQAKKQRLENAVAWDAEPPLSSGFDPTQNLAAASASGAPSKTGDQAAATTMTAASVQGSEPKQKQKTSVVGIVEVRKRDKKLGKAKGGQAVDRGQVSVAVPPSGDGGGPAGVELGGGGDDVWGGGDGAFW
ncbi:hypothetical protein V8E36_001561 [Tilletia maclaganii]